MKKATQEKYEKFARDALAVLVERVLSSESVAVARIAYGDLSDLINGPGARNMNRVLGIMGRKLKNLKVRGDSVPKIQSLVINKGKMVPGGGFKEFRKGYDKLSTGKRREIATQEQDNAYGFGKKWKNVLSQLDIPLIVTYPDEVEDVSLIVEGAKKRVTVNRYERSARAKDECKAKHGCQCSVCGFDFEKAYGKELGERYIHVHHLVELSEIKGEYKVDPVKDLRPVCPNCHAMLHKKRPALSIRRLKNILAENKKSRGGSV